MLARGLSGIVWGVACVEASCTHVPADYHALVYIFVHLVLVYLYMCDCHSAAQSQHHMYTYRSLAHCGTGGHSLHSARHTRQYLGKQYDRHTEKYM